MSFDFIDDPDLVEDEEEDEEDYPKYEDEWADIDTNEDDDFVSES